MLIPALALLKHARKHHYAVPAFNINNLEILKSVMQAAVAMKSPVIVQTSEGAIEYAGMNYLVALVREAAKSPVPVVFHLDHGKDLAIIKEAIKSGYTSVMMDGSSLPYEENVEKTKQVVKWAAMKGVSVEAELGSIKGIEDLVSVADRDAVLTNPEQAKKFVRATKCDTLAVAVGTAHGAFKFKGKTHLDFPRLKKIAELVKCPLVLHGASGVQEDVVKMAEHYGAKIGSARGVMDEDVKKAIKMGVAKVNIDTDLRLAFTAGLHEAAATMPAVIDPRKLLLPSMILMEEIAKHKMQIFGSKGKA